MDLSGLEVQAIEIINDKTLSRSEVMKRLRALLELYRLYQFFELFYRRYLMLLAQQNERRLSIAMIKEILNEPAFKALGMAFYFMMFAMLYSLSDAPEYFDELKKQQPDIDGSLRPIEGDLDHDEHEDSLLSY